MAIDLILKQVNDIKSMLEELIKDAFDLRIEVPIEETKVEKEIKRETEMKNDRNEQRQRQ